MLLKEEFATNMTYLEPAIESIESAVEGKYFTLSKCYTGSV